MGTKSVGLRHARLFTAGTGLVPALLVALVAVVSSQARATTLPVTTGLLVHLDANDPNNDGGATMPTNGTQVSTWSDTSGLGNNATQGDSNRQPIFETNVINGKAAFAFDGVATAGLGDFLTLGTALGKPSTYTVFIVALTTATTATSAPFASFNAGGSDVTSWGVFINAGGAAGGKLTYDFGNGAAYSDGTTTSAVLTNNVAAILAETYTSGDNFARVYLNGAQQTTTPGSTAATSVGGTAAGAAVGRLGDFSGYYFPGDIAQVIVYNRVLTSTEQQSVNAYLTNLYFPATPEPTSFALLAVSAVCVLRRRSAMR